MMEPHTYPLKDCHADRIRTPIYIVSVLVAILRQYFGTDKRIALQDSKYLWKEDQAESDIYIAEEWDFNREVIGKRPAILVGLDNQIFPRISMSDMLGFDPQTGTAHYITAPQTVARFRCLHESTLSSLELITEVKYFVDVFRKQIEQTYCFDTIRAVQASSPQKVEEYKDYFVSDLMCELKYQEKWGVTTEHLRVKSVSVDLRIQPIEEKIGLAQQSLG